MRRKRWRCRRAGCFRGGHGRDSGRRTGSQASRYEPDCILPEVKAAGKGRVWYLVRCEGGEMGSALETWGPESHVMGLRAWGEWMEAKEAAARQRSRGGGQSGGEGGLELLGTMATEQA
eukprot:5119786-Pleurochrysis_carterae.AAC.4